MCNGTTCCGRHKHGHGEAAEDSQHNRVEMEEPGGHVCRCGGKCKNHEEAPVEKKRGLRRLLAVFSRAR